MVGNVTGVSQLLETVGVAGPQAGAESVPGQSFATVMQQTSEQNGTPLPQPVTAKKAEGDDTAMSTPQSAQKIATPAQEAAKAESRKDKDSPVLSKSASNWVAGSGAKGVADKTSFASLTGRIVAQPQPFQQDEILPASLGDTSGKTVKGAGEAAEIAVAPPLPAVTTGTTVSATADATKDASGKIVLQPETLRHEVAPVVKSTGAGAGQKLEAGARRVGKETSNVSGKQAPKQGDSKSDVTLTALIPQGTPEVPQSFVAAPDGSPSAVVMSVPVMVASNAGDFGINPAAESMAVDKASSVQGLQGPRVQGTQVQATPKQSSILTNTTLPLTEGDAAKVDAEPDTRPIAGKPIVAAEKLLPQAAVEGKTAVAAPVQAMQNQQGIATEPTSPEETGAGIQSIARSGAASVSKPTAQGGRNGLNVSTSVTATVPDSGADDTQQVSAAAVSDVHLAPDAQPAQPSASRSVAPAAVAKTTSKPMEKPTAMAANLQPVEGQSAVPVKATAPEELAGTTAPAKDKADAAVPAVASQPAVSPVMSGSHTANVTVPAIPASLPHTPVAANAGVSDTASIVSAMRAEADSSAGGSLPHTTLSSTPNSLEVGVSSGTHGWLKIRAELNAAGEVNASLTGANPAAASRLRSDLPALSSFLQDERLSVGTVDVRSALHSAMFENSSTFSQSGIAGSTGTAVGADAGAAGGRAQQQAQQGGENVHVLNGARDSDEVLPGRITETAMYGNTTEAGGSEALSSTGYRAGGSWLNVRV